MISVKEVKKIREQLGLTHIVIFGVSEGGIQHIATHGESKVNAEEAARAGNKLKKSLEWPEGLCKSKPMERICKYCEFWQQEYHRPGDRILDNPVGDCLNNPEKVKRYEKDIACAKLSPII